MLSFKIITFLFEHASELIHVQIHLTSVIEFMMILNKTQKQRFGTKPFFIKNVLKIMGKVLEKILWEKVISGTVGGWKLESLPKLNSFTFIF